MTSGNGSGIWKMTTGVLAAVVVTGTGSWLAQPSYISKQDVRELITAQIKYPWDKDRAIVMAHVNSKSPDHETASEKRTRIREELSQATLNLELRLEIRLKAIENGILSIKESIKK